MKNFGWDNNEERRRVAIEEELEEARIEIMRGEKTNENGSVPTSLFGKLGNFIFRRSCTSWLVSGDKLPSKVIEELRNDPVSKHILADKHSPEKWEIKTEVALRVFADIIKKHGLS